MRSFLSSPPLHDRKRHTLSYDPGSEFHKLTAGNNNNA